MKSFQQAAQLTVCALLLVAASQVAQSQILDQNAQLEAGTSPNPSSAAQNHILKGTYINTVRPLNATQLAAGTTPIDAVTTIMCPGTSGTCTIEFDQNIQLDGTGTDNNQFNLCQLLDGNILAPGCYLMGTIPFSSPPIFAYSSQSISGVPVGIHTVQSALESFYGAGVAFYNMTYHVYKP